VNQAIALAWELLQRGNAAGAEEILRPFMMPVVTDPLVPMLGAIRLQQGRFSEAVPLLERARALFPRQTRYISLHGAALAGLGALEPAAAAFQAAIKADPNADAPYLSLGEMQRRLSRPQEAQATYRKLLRLQPDNVDGLLALSSVLAEMGELAQAEAPLRRALLHAKDPKTKAAIHNNLAVSLGGQNKQAEALENLELAQSLAPGFANLDQRRINILFKLGRFEECLTLYEKLLAHDPSDPQMHRAYNSLLYRLGRRQDYLSSYDLAPKTREILLGKARMLAMEKRGAEAHDIYASLLARAPDDLTAAAGLAGSLLLMARPDQAVTAFEQVLKRPDADAAMFAGAAEAALLVGDPDKAQAFCQAGLKNSPFDQTCLALLGTAWRWKEDERDEELNGYDRLIQSFDLDPPDGFSSMESFNAELGAWLAGEHPATREYLEQTLRGGTQTEGFLFGAGHVLLQKLKSRFDEAVRGYIASLPYQKNHPFLTRRSASFGYVGAWSSRMHQEGFHINHVHPQGWISSCYYVTVPDVAKNVEQKQGWIKFGEPELNLPLKNRVRRAIEPVPGRLVLFPSYMWHGTIAFRSDGARTTIAFDAAPR
jgi:tetratricopeptide (TPR) repeat protein